MRAHPPGLAGVRLERLVVHPKRRRQRRRPGAARRRRGPPPLLHASTVLAHREAGLAERGDERAPVWREPLAEVERLLAERRVVLCPAEEGVEDVEERAVQAAPARRVHLGVDRRVERRHRLAPDDRVDVEVAVLRVWRNFVEGGDEPIGARLDDAQRGEALGGVVVEDGLLRVHHRREALLEDRQRLDDAAEEDAFLARAEDGRLDCQILEPLGVRRLWRPRRRVAQRVPPAEQRLEVRPTAGMPRRSQTVLHGRSTQPGSSVSAQEPPGLAFRHSHEKAAASVESTTSAALSAASGIVAASPATIGISARRSWMAACATSDGSCADFSIHAAPAVRRSACMLVPAPSGSRNPCSNVSQPSHQPVDGPFASAFSMTFRAGHLSPSVNVRRCDWAAARLGGAAKSSMVRLPSPANGQLMA